MSGSIGSGKPASGRFGYVKYDEMSFAVQAEFKKKVEELETMIETKLKANRPKKLALQHLEDFSSWIGTGIRDDQVARIGDVPLNEARDFDAGATASS
jgi:hypothetical protein